MSTQPEARQTPLHDLLDQVPEDIVLGIPGDEPVFQSYTSIPIGKLAQQAAAELRRLHGLNQELLEALKAIKDGTQFWESYPLEHCYGKARAAIAKTTGEQT